MSGFNFICEADFIQAHRISLKNAKIDDIMN
jgi:hypothetical protein